MPLEEYTQLHEDLSKVIILCNHLAAHCTDLRIRTFEDFSAVTGYSVEHITQAWNLGHTSAGNITRFITKIGWRNKREARRRAEMEWRSGHTNHRPRYLFMMPRRQVLIDETIDHLAVTHSACVSASSSLSSSQPDIGNSHDMGDLPERIRKFSTS
ncbi:unnamed protein product [Aureobasidium uvarum]|uniref:Uncharacterized protein n=1 Tax=Aureobasidium uvarum TaxID=2773716 RepID=A0A9N8KLB9_9PEZI|nr:unnamed protein product [Aureobasidium uvarum]